MKYVVVCWLFFCISCSIVCAVSCQESKDMQNKNHEFIGLKEDVTFVTQQNDQLLPQLKNNIIVLSKGMPSDHPAVLFKLAYLLHYYWLLKMVDNDAVCSIVSNCYALRYFLSFSDEQKKICKHELAQQNEPVASLIQAVEKLSSNNINQEIMKLLTQSQDDTLQAILLSASIYAAPTHLLMTQGCDDRLVLDTTTKLNRYYTSPLPCNDTIFRSSSTTSHSSEEAFLQAEQLRQELLLKTLKKPDEPVFDNAMHKIRQRLANVFLNSSTNKTSINFFASGTNAEYLPSFLALAGHQQWVDTGSIGKKHLVTNFVAAETEIGSKSSLAAQMKHISSLLPTGESVMVNTMLNQFPEGVMNVVSLPARNFESGEVIELPILEAELEGKIENLITQHNQQVVLHTVHYAKTGVHMPSYEFACRMKKTYSDSIVVFADAAQTRCSRELINNYLKNDIIVLLSGSKFYSGPSFTGIILMPESQTRVLNNSSLFVPSGLQDYCSAYDFDQSLVNMRSKLSTWKNVGLLLRLCASMSEIEQLFNLPESARESIISSWSARAKSLIELDDCFECVSANTDFTDNIAQTNTVYPFKVADENGKCFDMDQLKKMHRWMTLDLSLNMPHTVSHQEKKVAAKKCLLGQPVKIANQDGREIGAIRLAFGVQTLRAIVQSGLEQEFENDKIIIAKLHLIKRHFEFLDKQSL